MAEKIISGDSLQNEFVAKFNGMADEVNELKESGGGGSGGAIVELSGESGKLTDEQYLQCTNPTTVIKWFNGSGAHIVYEYWRFASPTYEFKSVYIDADECINNIIEIDQINHSWKRTQAAYDGGSTVSVTQTLTSGTKIGAITVDGKTTALYAPEGGGAGGGGGSVPADAIIDVDKLPTEEDAYLFGNGEKVEEYLMRKVVVHIVDTLPEVGEPLLTGSPSATMNVYYQKGDNEAYCYFTESVKPGYNYVGWSTLASGCAVLSITYGGIVTDESQATAINTLYLVYKASNINKNAFYGKSVLEVYTLMGGKKNEIQGLSISVEIVDTLPAVGKPYMDTTTMTFILYYQKSDGLLYGFVPTDMGMETDTWLEVSQMDMPYTVISSDEEAVNEEELYLVRKQKRELYWYNNAWEAVIQDVSKLIPQTKDTFTMVHSELTVLEKTVNIHSNIGLAQEYIKMMLSLYANRNSILQMTIKIITDTEKDGVIETQMKMSAAAVDLITAGTSAYDMVIVASIVAPDIGLTECILTATAMTAVFNSATNAQKFANATVTYALYY